MIDCLSYFCSSIFCFTGSVNHVFVGCDNRLVCSEIAFYADFVNDTEYVNKVSYGYNPSTVVKGVAVVGDPGRSYRLAEFMHTLLNAMVSKATLLSCE